MARRTSRPSGAARRFSAGREPGDLYLARGGRPLLVRDLQELGAALPRDCRGGRRRRAARESPQLRRIAHQAAAAGDAQTRRAAPVRAGNGCGAALPDCCGGVRGGNGAEAAMMQASRRVQVVRAFVLAAVVASAGGPIRAQSPPQPPKDWGPMSINLEDIPYRMRSGTLSFTLEGQDVRMAYMDVPPSAAANGRAIVLFHGLNFFGEAWTTTIEVLSKAGFRVIVAGPDRVRPIVEGDRPVHHQPPCREHPAADSEPRPRQGVDPRPLDGRDGREPLRLIVPGDGGRPGADEPDWTRGRAHHASLARHHGRVQGHARAGLCGDPGRHAGTT